MEAERNGKRFQVAVDPSRISWWASFASSASLAIAATFLLLRAPFWHLSRRFFAGALLWCLFFASDTASTLEGAAVIYTVVAPSGAALMCSHGSSRSSTRRALPPGYC